MEAADPQRLEPLAVVDGTARVLPGSAYGVWTSTLVMHVRAADVDASRLAALDQAMLELLEEPFEDATPGASGAIALLQRLNHWHAALQRQQNVPVYGACALEATGAAYRVALPVARADATRIALRWTLQAMNQLLREPHESAPLGPRLAAVRKKLGALGGTATNPIHFVAAAHAVGIPLVSLSPGTYWIGTGRHSRWLNSTITDATPALGVQLAKDKVETARVLRSFGLPVPQHVLAKSEDEAVQAAARLGERVVVKPADQDQGRGVFAGLRGEAAVRKAWRAARAFSPRILVEAHCEGQDYRFTVVHGKLVKVMHRQAGSVRGDGVRTVAGLVAEVQASAAHQRALRRQGKPRLELDEEALDLLAEQRLAPDSIPAAGRTVLLRRKSNISSGGSHALVPLDTVHPANRELALQAARLMRLDIAGVDLILPDVARPWHEGPAIVCEVNAQPQIGRRDTPHIYAEILRELVGGDGAVPLHLVVADDEAARTREDEFLRLAGDLHCNGVSSIAGTWLAGRRRLTCAPDGFSAARNLLAETTLDAALIVMGPQEIVRSGLPAARFASARLHAPAPDDPSWREALALLRPHALQVHDR